MTYYRSFGAGQTVVWPGDRMDFVASVVSGPAIMTQTMEDGRHQMVGLLLPSDFLGRPGRIAAPYDVTATTDLVLCCFRPKPFEEMMAATPHVAQRLLDMTLEEIDAARDWMVLLGPKTAREKIASLLSNLARRDTGLQANATTGPISFDLPLTREEMAHCLGLPLETVSRQMNALKRDGVVTLGDKRRIGVPDFDRLTGETGDSTDDGFLRRHFAHKFRVKQRVKMQDDDPKTPGFAQRSHGRLSVQVSASPRDLMADAQVKGAFTVKVVTLFPEAFPGTLGLSLTGKALDLGLWRLVPVALRPFGEGKHRNVDDTPAGGGAGMVLRADVLDRALTAAAAGTTPDRLKWPVIYLSPRGKPFDQTMARRFAACDGLTLICGRFEGIDQRIIDHHTIEEVSLGDFVLTGGEIAAQAMLDATVRLLPKVLGNQASTIEESFSDGLLEHPHYTKPALWNDLPIPEVLQSGHHAEIAKWRKAQAEELTKLRRPDLWQTYQRKK